MSLTDRQFELISQAYSELCALHPELKDREQRRKTRGRVRGQTRKRQVLANSVSEAFPVASPEVVESRVEELVVLSEGRPAILIEHGDYDLTQHETLVLANRDASLIVDDAEVAAYFSRIFEFDWNRASTRVREAVPGILVQQPGDPVPAGYEVVSWQEAVL